MAFGVRRLDAIGDDLGLLTDSLKLDLAIALFVRITKLRVALASIFFGLVTIVIKCGAMVVNFRPETFVEDYLKQGVLCSVNMVDKC